MLNSSESNIWEKGNKWGTLYHLSTFPPTEFPDSWDKELNLSRVVKVARVLRTKYQNRGKLHREKALEICRVLPEASAENLTVCASKETTQKLGVKSFKTMKGNSLQSSHGPKNSLWSHQTERKNFVMHWTLGRLFRMYWSVVQKNKP